MPAEAGLRVEVAYSPRPDAVDCVSLVVAPGTTAVQAAAQSGLLPPGASLDALAVAIWGRLAEPAQALREGDRVELLRPLKVDPKEARRLRYRRQRTRPAP